MSHTSFLGIPVEGDISRGEARVPQRPLEEFQPLILAVLNDPTIIEFGWTQYTPYFNDGEPCVFGAGDIWVRTDADKARVEEGDDEEDEVDYLEALNVTYGHPSLGKYEYSYTGTYPDREKHVVSYQGPDPERLDRCLALNQAVTGGEFDNVLLEAFGDHARVTVSKSGIQIEFYEHD
jgi:hypothetical protein